jgi:hypothetical protein
MSRSMVQFRYQGGTPSLAEAATALGLEPEALDPEFGVIATDPADNLYVVRVSAEDAERSNVAGATGDGSEGVFSDPRIAPFGPPED